MFGQLWPSALFMALMLTERTLFFHDVVNSSDKPSGLLNVKLWTTSVAKPRVTRDRALTFGPGTRDWSSVTAPDSCATSVSSTTAPTPSTRTTSNGLQSETEPAGLPTYGGLEDEKGSLEDIRSVLGKRGSSAVRVLVLAATTHVYDYSVPLLDGRQS